MVNSPAGIGVEKELVELGYDLSKFVFHCIPTCLKCTLISSSFNMILVTKFVKRQEALVASGLKKSLVPEKVRFLFYKRLAKRLKQVIFEGWRKIRSRKICLKNNLVEFFNFQVVFQSHFSAFRVKNNCFDFQANFQIHTLCSTCTNQSLEV